jgi:hypothetical protein
MDHRCYLLEMDAHGNGIWITGVIYLKWMRMARVGCEALDVDNTFHLWTGLSCGGRNGNMYHTVRVSEDSYSCGGTIQRLDVEWPDACVSRWTMAGFNLN